jgi:hypothetical protein
LGEVLEKRRTQSPSCSDLLSAAAEIFGRQAEDFPEIDYERFLVVLGIFGRS